MPDALDPTRMQLLSTASLCLTTLLGLCMLVLLIPRGRVYYARFEQALSRLAERPLLASGVLFFWVICFRLLALPLLPVPTPSVHDEFSYLLAADTFAHGRLTNPSHPLWLSFETFHVNWHPTYHSIYPPMQGFVLAIGQLLGHPWIGVLLSAAALVVAVYWALRGWMPSRWAFLAAVITWLKLGFTSYWINSYWGGAVAAIGGALVLGALGRIRRQPNARNAILLAVGVAILANSRPYEGSFFCLPVAVWLVLWLAGKFRSKITWRARLQNTILPIAGLLVLTGAFMGYYNWRLTGNPALMPRTLNMRTYYSTPVFLWEHPMPALHYNNLEFQIFYSGWLRGDYFGDWFDIQRVSRAKMRVVAIVYFWLGALLILPGLLFALLDRKMRMFALLLLTTLPAILAVVWSQAHYAAPLTCVFYGLLVQAVRHLRTMRTSALQFGVALSRVAVLLLVLDTGSNLFRQFCDPIYPCGGSLGSRAALIKTLGHVPGKHVLIVRYSDVHSVHDEWVFNRADIDGGKIVWARELGPQQNAKLLDYFKDRQAWLVEPDRDPRKLTPYVPAPLAMSK